MALANKPNDPISEFSFSIFRLNSYLMRNGDRITQFVGQTSARWQVLGRLGYAPQTVATIARSMGHARQSVQRIAHVLVKEGLAEYAGNPGHKRAPLLSLTPKGKEALDAIYSQYSHWQEHIAGKLDASQLKALATSLNAVAEVLEADESKK